MEQLAGHHGSSFLQTLAIQCKSARSHLSLFTTHPSAPMHSSSPPPPRRWNLDEVRNGDAFRYHFRTDMPTKPVLQPWNTTDFRYELKNKTQPGDAAAVAAQVQHHDLLQTYTGDADPSIRRVQLVEALVLKEEYRSLYRSADQQG